MEQLRLLAPFQPDPWTVLSISVIGGITISSPVAGSGLHYENAIQAGPPSNHPEIGGPVGTVLHPYQWVYGAPNAGDAWSFTPPLGFLVPVDGSLVQTASSGLVLA